MAGFVFLQKLFPFGQRLINDVLGGFGAVEEHPEIKRILLASEAGIGQHQRDDDDDDRPQWRVQAQVAPEPSDKCEHRDEKEPLGSLEGGEGHEEL